MPMLTVWVLRDSCKKGSTLRWCEKMRGLARSGIVFAILGPGQPKIGWLGPADNEGLGRSSS